MVSPDGDVFRRGGQPHWAVTHVTLRLEPVSPIEGDTGMNPDKIVIRFDQVAEQAEGPVKRVVGFVRAKNMLQLFDAADLEANPRSAKAGAVTADIIDSIKET